MTHKLKGHKEKIKKKKDQEEKEWKIEVLQLFNSYSEKGVAYLAEYIINCIEQSWTL